MMKYKGSSDVYLALFIAAVLVIGTLSWKFSQSFGLDWDTGSRVFMGELFVLAASIGATYFGILRSVWPILLALAWFCLNPAIDYWAVNGFGGDDWYKYLGPDKPWWSHWYSKASIFFGIIFGGYAIERFVFEKRYW